LRRMAPTYATVRMLIRGGILDSVAMEMTRPELFWAFFHRDKEQGLFARPQVPVFIGDYGSAKKIFDETETLGLIVSSHPLTVFRSHAVRVLREFRRNPTGPGSGSICINSRGIGENIGATVLIAGILITGKEVRTKKKLYMGFFSFEDPFGVFETVLFPQYYLQLLRKLEYGRAFFIYGKVDSEFNTPIIEIHDLFPLGGEEAPGRTRVRHMLTA
jgi:DNA polymerase III alpha subunit